MPRNTGYWKIVEHFRQQIQNGLLKPGDTLPSFKEAGAQFGVAHTTVNRAYRVLKQEGLTLSVQGVGTVVAAFDGEPGEAAAASGGTAAQGLMAFVERQEYAPHTELSDCINLVAASVWAAAWRQARADQVPDPKVEAEVDRLIVQSDFLRKALYRHNWRNVNAVLAAFRDAGLAGSADVPAFYTHVNHIPVKQV
jgi:DNA-binding transcriptional regulator YhcF (GntR family)